jgi:hypothetical protein
MAKRNGSDVLADERFPFGALAEADLPRADISTGSEAFRSRSMLVAAPVALIDSFSEAGSSWLHLDMRHGVNR